MRSTCFGGVLFEDRPNLNNIAKVDIGALPMIYQFQRNGMRVDVSFFRDYAKWLREDCEVISDSIEKLTGYRINVGSPDQVAELLFKRLGIKQIGKVWMTKGSDKHAPRPVVDDDVLEKLKKKHVCIPMIQDYRERVKLASTYCDAIIAAERSGRLHPRFKDTTVETGRLSAEKPNVLAIPTRSTLGKRIREGFIADDGDDLATIDLSQIEMRVGAHDSNCSAMIEIFHQGIDMYWGTANLMFKFEPEEFKRILKYFRLTDGKSKDEVKHVIDKKWITESGLKWYYEMKGSKRFPAKTTTLLVIYDGKAPTLLNEFLVAGATDWTEAKCEQTIKDWYTEFWEVLDRRLEHHKRAKTVGYVNDWFGRIRHIPQVTSVHSWVKAEGLRGAGNMPGQATAQGMIKLVMAEVEHIRLNNRHFRHGIKPLLQVHDELLFGCNKSMTDEWMEICKRVITNVVPGFRVPVKSSWAKGPRWIDLEK